MAEIFPPDGGYGWVVMAANVCMMMLLSCSFSAFGMYFLAFVTVFDSSKTAITWILAVQMGTMGFTGLVAGPMVKIYGPRKVVIVGTMLIAVGYILSALLINNVPLLYLTFGCIPGMGYGCQVVTYPASLQMYFKKRYSLSLGITMAGVSIGIFIWPPLTALLINYYGWKGAMLITASIQLNGLVVGAVMRPPPTAHHIPLADSANTTNDKTPTHARASLAEFCKSVLDLSVLKNLTFMLYCIGKFCQHIGHALFAYLPVRGVALGATPTEAALLVSIAGILSGVCRVIFGFVGDKVGLKRIYLNGGFTCLVGALSVGSVVFQTYSAYAVYAAAFGIFAASYATLDVACVVDLCGRELVTKAYGIVMVSFGLSALTSNPLIGFLLDVTGDTKYPFLVLGLVQIVGGVAIFMCGIFARWGQSQIQEEKIADLEILGRRILDEEKMATIHGDEADLNTNMLKYEGDLENG